MSLDPLFQFSSTLLIVLLFIGFITLVFGVFTVQQQSVAIIERFGKFLRIAEPGLRFCIPFIDQKAGRLNLRINQMDVHVETKTKDNVFVKILLSVQYEVMKDKVYNAWYQLDNASAQIQSFVFDVVRAKVPNITLDDLFAKKDEIAIDVKHELHDVLSNFGYNLIKALVTDIQPDANVKNAMNEINTAQRLRVAAQEKAEAKRIMTVTEAKAEAEANVLRGEGIAGQRKAIMEGLTQVIEEMKAKDASLSVVELTRLIVLIQYFDMLKEVGSNSKSNIVFMGHSPGSMNEASKQLTEALFAANKENLE